MEKGSGTRSGMLWEVERILDECGDELPQLLLMENVPQVVGKKNKGDFDKWVSFLESKGYTNKYCMLNAKEVGYPEPVPQNRNRCFMISVLEPKCDIVFPEKVERTKVLKDILEDNVDEKYYLSDKMIKYISADNEKWTGNNNEALINKTYASTLNTNEGSRRCDASNYISNDVGDNYNLKINNKSLKETLEQNNIDDTCYIDTYNKRIDKEKSGTITTGVSFRNNTFLAIKNNTKKGYLEAQAGDGVDLAQPNSETRRGRVQKESTQTITTQDNLGVVVEDDWDLSDLD